MVGVEQEDEVERLDDFRIDVDVLAGKGEHHVEEVLGVSEVALGVDDWKSVSLAVSECGEGADLGNQACCVIGEAFLAVVAADQVRVE